MPSPPDGAGHGHVTDLGERAAGADGELVHDAVPAGLDVEEPPAGRDRGVHRAGVGRGLAEERQLAARARRCSR